METKLPALCGIATPIVFAAVLLVSGQLYPGYDHVNQYMSVLGARESPVSGLMNILGFSMLGLLTIPFAYGLYSSLAKTQGAKVAFILLCAAGVSMVLVGLFPCDPLCTLSTPIGYLHTLVTISAVFSITLATLVAGFAFWENGWKAAAVFSFAICAALVLAGPAYLLGLSEAYKGLAQRLVMGLGLVWIEAVAIRLYFLKGLQRLS